LCACYGLEKTDQSHLLSIDLMNDALKSPRKSTVWSASPLLSAISRRQNSYDLQNCSSQPLNNCCA
jgi:hypothetical protein